MKKGEKAWENACTQVWEEGRESLYPCIGGGKGGECQSLYTCVGEMRGRKTNTKVRNKTRHNRNEKQTDINTKS